MKNIDKIVFDMKKYCEFFRCKNLPEVRKVADDYIKGCINDYLPEGIQDSYYKLWEKMKK